MKKIKLTSENILIILSILFLFTIFLTYPFDKQETPSCLSFKKDIKNNKFIYVKWDREN